MNSNSFYHSNKLTKATRIIAVLALLLSNENVSGHRIEQKSVQMTGHQAQIQSGGIFGRMIEQVTAGDRLQQEKRKIAERKAQQLAQAEAEYQKQVAEEEAEEAAKKKKAEEEAEAAALEAARNSPQAKMLAAANEAAASINLSEMEANIQATLQAKIDAGASKDEILEAANQEMGVSFATLPAPTSAIKVTPSTQDVISKVLAKHKNQKAPAESIAQTESKASQEKVKEMAHKLGIPFTPELLALGSNAAISDALIEKAVAAGKTEEQINAAMASI